jgi:hypothetical protein
MRQGSVVSVIIFCAVVAALNGQTQRIPVGTATISGTVIASDSGLPLKGARVAVKGHAIGSAARPIAQSDDTELRRIVETDASGTFSFPRMPAGVFQVTVESNTRQYLDVNYGERRPGGQAEFMRLADEQKVDLRILLMRPAVITGRVVGPHGAPLTQIHVAAVHYDTSNGFRHLYEAMSADTDDRGIYRLFGLDPGSYFVVAKPDVEDLFDDFSFSSYSDAPHIERAIRSATVVNPARPGMPPTIAFQPPPDQDFDMAPSGFLPTYAPSAMSPDDATVVTVAGNEERTGVDIAARAIPTSIVRVEVTTPVDPRTRISAWLLNDDRSIQGGMSCMVETCGSFRFQDVPPGTYTILAILSASYGQPPLADEQKLWGQTRVTVGGEPVVRINLSLQAPRSISGIVAFDMSQRPDLTKRVLTVRAQPAADTRSLSLPNGPLQAKVTADGRFTIAGVPAGRYYLYIDGPYHVKSAEVGRQDTLDFPLDFPGDRDLTDAVLTITDKRTELNGTLTDSSGQPALGYSILVAPTDSRYWCRGSSRRFDTVPVELDGRFSVARLPSGSYQLAVVADPEPGWSGDPEFLRAIARTSVMVIIPDGGKVTQNLRVK